MSVIQDAFVIQHGALITRSIFSKIFMVVVVVVVCVCVCGGGGGGGGLLKTDLLCATVIAVLYVIM